VIAGCLLALGAALADGDVEIVERRSYYDVRARDFADLRAQMRKLQLHGPADDPSSARTHQHLDVSYELEKNGDACRMRDLAIRVEVEIVLPRLVAGGSLGRDADARWDEMIKALGAHEDGHRDNVVRAAHELGDRLRGLEGTDCRKLKREAQRIHDAVVTRMQIRDQRYDERTAHGIRQGSELTGAAEERDRRGQLPESWRK
jgi:predicted secreted Zn-dependent protease